MQRQIDLVQIHMYISTRSIRKSRCFDALYQSVLIFYRVTLFKTIIFNAHTPPSTTSKHFTSVQESKNPLMPHSCVLCSLKRNIDLLDQLRDSLPHTVLIRSEHGGSCKKGHTYMCACMYTYVCAYILYVYL